MSISLIIIFSLLGVISALFTYFLDFCFWEGNIFDFYYNFLEKKIKPKYPKLAKPLGICNVCFNFWVSLFLYSYYLFILNLTPYWFIYIIPYISISMFISLKLNIDGYLDKIKNYFKNGV